MKVSSYFALLALAVLAVGASAYALEARASGSRTEAAAAAGPEGSGLLDGKVFSARLGPEGEPADKDDRLIFNDGLLLSVECRRLCDFPARPYYVREASGALEFVSITRCPTRDAVIVWRGEVAEGEIRGIATWTTKRWYWTVERDFHFTGRLLPGAAADLAMD